MAIQTPLKRPSCYREDGCGRKAGINIFDLNVRDHFQDDGVW